MKISLIDMVAEGTVLFIFGLLLFVNPSLAIPLSPIAMFIGLYILGRNLFVECNIIEEK